MRQKLYILAILASIVVCTNCSHDDLIDSDMDDMRNAMSFHTDIKEFGWGEDARSATRGTPTNNVDEIGIMASSYDGLWVDAIGTATPDIMHNRLLSRQDNEWKVTPNVFWPVNSRNTSFFAYSPMYNANNGITITSHETEGVPRLTYIMPQRAGYQPDLLLGAPLYDKVRDDGVVSLKLDHALTAVGFAIHGVDPSLKVEKIGLKYIKCGGTINMDSGAVWEDLRKSDYTYFAELNFDDGKDYISPTPTSKTVTADNGYIMVVPQTFDMTTTAIVEIYINRQVITKSLRGTKPWVAGQPFIYNIEISSDM